MTGVHLSGTVTLQADVALRDEISAWLHAQGKDPDAFRRASLVAWRDADLSGASDVPLPSATAQQSSMWVLPFELWGLPSIAVLVP